MQQTLISLTSASTPWLGVISAQHALESGTTSDDKIDAAISSLETYFVPEDSQAPARCIDGRPDPAAQSAHLGAQIPGGTPGSALAFRLARIAQGDTNNSVFVDDARLMIDLVKQHQLTPGDHRDQNGNGTGCGAIDKMDKALGTLINPTYLESNRALVSTLLGPDFDVELYAKLMQAGKIVWDDHEKYLAAREKSLNDIEKVIGQKVPVLLGVHNECIVIINKIAGTTFDPTGFTRAHEGIQSFNYDIWRTFELADALFGDDINTKNSFIHARIMTAVATLMVLTDGTQRLVVRA